MFVIPAAGRIVRDPISRKALPAEGREVPESSHWFRRLAVGDVVRRAEPVLVVAEALGAAAPEVPRYAHRAPVEPESFDGSSADGGDGLS